MSEQPFECSCDSCTSPGPDWYVAPLWQLTAVRERAARAGADRAQCPRCNELLGELEPVVDTVGYTHFVQPCAGCLALWVAS